MDDELREYLARLAALSEQGTQTRDDLLLGTLSALAKHLIGEMASFHPAMDDLIILCCHGHWARTPWVCDQAGTGVRDCPLAEAQKRVRSECKWMERYPKPRTIG